MPFTTRYLTEKAVDAIQHDLRKHREFDGSVIEFIRSSFDNVLGMAGAEKRLQHLPHLDGH